MITMARKPRPNPGRPKGEKPSRSEVISFRATKEFSDWFERLIDHSRRDANWARLPPSAVIVQALICLAKERGFLDEAPKA